MKKKVKWVVIGFLALLSIAYGVYAATAPLAVPALHIAPKTAELFFTEQGAAEAPRVVDVYAFAAGRLESLRVMENEAVSEGDVLCVVDFTHLSCQLADSFLAVRGYETQLENLELEEQRQRDSLIASKNSLLGELKALEAQMEEAGAASLSQAAIKEEQLRLQEIVVAQSRRDLERAQADLEKSEVLYNFGSLSKSEYDGVLEVFRNMESILKQNEAQLQVIESGQVSDNREYYAGAMESIRAQIAGIDTALGRSYNEAMKEYYKILMETAENNSALLEKQIKDCYVKAPVSGIVTSLYIKDKNAVTTGQPVAQITPDSSVNVEVYVSTSDIGDIEVNQPVELILKRQSGDLTFPGTIIEIGREAVVRLNVLGVEQRRVKVTVKPEAASEIKKGYDADVKFVTYREENKLTVPKTAVFTADDRDMVWVVKEGRAVMTEIVKGRELRTEFVVESGLAAGDFVITDAGFDGVKEGARVKVE